MKLIKIHEGEFQIPFKEFRENRLEKFKKAPNEVIIHCSDSDSSSYGASAIHRDHLKRDNETWAGCGYHFVIESDGTLVNCRPIEYVGSHCAEQGKNYTTIGICVCGKLFWNYKQEETLIKLLKRLGYLIDNPVDTNDDGIDLKFAMFKAIGRISPHSKYNNFKTCPNFSVEGFIMSGVMQTYLCYKDDKFPGKYNTKKEVQE